MRQLGSLKPPETVAAAARTWSADDAADAVRAEAVRALAAFDKPKHRRRTARRAGRTTRRRSAAEVVNTLAARKEWAKALLAGDGRRRRSTAPTVTDNTILRIQAFKDSELNALIEKAWGRTRPTPAELNELIDKTRGLALRRPGVVRPRPAWCSRTPAPSATSSTARGRRSARRSKGPARDIEYILVNVLDPNRVIGAPYFVRTARLLDDTVFQGVLAEEDDKTITLKIENGVLKKIKKADLDGPVQRVREVADARGARLQHDRRRTSATSSAT